MAETACYCGYCKLWMSVSMWETHIKTQKHQEGVVLLLSIVDNNIKESLKNAKMPTLLTELPERMGGDYRCCICGVLIGPGVGYFKREFRGHFYIYCGDQMCNDKLEQEIRSVKGTKEMPKLDYY